MNEIEFFTTLLTGFGLGGLFACTVASFVGGSMADDFRRFLSRPVRKAGPLSPRASSVPWREPETGRDVSLIRINPRLLK